MSWSVCFEPGCGAFVPAASCWCYEHLRHCEETCEHGAHWCEAPAHYCERHAETLRCRL